MRSLLTPTGGGSTEARWLSVRVESMTDVVVGPALSSSATGEQQAEALEGDLQDFFSWCDGNSLGALRATWPCHAELPQGAKQAYYQLFARLADGYRPYSELPDGEAQQVTLGVADEAILRLLPYPPDWTALGEALEEALAGFGGSLATAADSEIGLMTDGQFSNVAAAGNAIACEDGPFPSAVPAYEHLATQLAKLAPDFAFWAWRGSGCAYWPVKPEIQPPAVHVTGGRTVLLVGSTGDPLTPYSWAQAVARQLGNARLLTRDGPGHTGYFYSSCIQTWTDQFFESLTLPPKGTVCRSDELDD